MSRPSASSSRVHHRLHPLAPFRPERLLDVALAERVAEVVVRVGHAALPAGTHLARALERAAEEVEVLGDERLREEGCGRVQHLPAQVRSEGGEGRPGRDPVEGLEEVGDDHVEAGDRGRLQPSEVDGPVEAGASSPGGPRASSCGRASRDPAA